MVINTILFIVVNGNDVLACKIEMIHMNSPDNGH